MIQELSFLQKTKIMVCGIFLFPAVVLSGLFVLSIIAKIVLGSIYLCCKGLAYVFNIDIMWLITPISIFMFLNLLGAGRRRHK